MTKEFLDNQQYTELSILRYWAIYGHNYISPGGENANDNLELFEKNFAKFEKL